MLLGRMNWLINQKRPGKGVSARLGRASFGSLIAIIYRTSENLQERLYRKEAAIEEDPPE